MHLLLCIDTRDGMSFCGRRLSRDSALYRHIQSLTQGKPLWMAPDSAGLFGDCLVKVHESFLEAAGEGEYAFVETQILSPIYEGLESVTLYCWNRAYPATVKFPRGLLDGMHLTEVEEFPGTSHEKITMQRYTK